MPEKTDFNITPYYDDYSEDKNFHKVLYRAGRPLQSRELTQSQSILQNQIERFGSHIFKEGSIVSGAQCEVDMALYFVKVSSANPNDDGDANVETYRTATHTKYLQGTTSGVIALVITSAAETSSDKLTLFVRYLTQGTDANNSYAFVAGETLQQVTLDENGVASDLVSDNNDFNVVPSADIPNGRSSIANISEGIIFSRGFFVKVPAQELILEKYSGKPSYKVGLSIGETLVSSGTDDSLQDNATGTSNENAAGADRFKIALDLTKEVLTADSETTDTNFIELVRVNNGIIELQVNKPLYSEIENTLARRTYDASGDFVVRQFSQSLREHLDDTTNRGFYLSALGGKEEQFVMQVSPGKAYVKGYEIDKIGTSTIPLAKSRETKALTGTNTPIRLGNILKVTNAHSLPEFGNEAGAEAQEAHNTCLLYDQPLLTGQGGASNLSSLSKNIVGFARVRDITHEEGVDTLGIYSNVTIWNLGMFDVKMFTRLTGTRSGSINVGDIVTGSSSGAIGVVAHTVSTTDVYVHDMTGTFTTSDTLATTGVSSGTVGTLTAVRTYNIDRVRLISQVPKNTSRETFTANISLDQDNTLTGSVTISGTAMTGFGTRFATELKEGDVIIDGLGVERVINATPTSNTSATLTASSGAMSNSNCTRRRAKLHEQDKTAAIFAWPRDWVATHTPDDVTVRRQEVFTVTGNAITINTGSHATFGQINSDNFTIAVIEQAGSPTNLANGDILNVEDYDSADPQTSGSGQSLTLANSTANMILDEGAKLKVTYTVNQTTVPTRIKTLNKSQVLKVGSARSAGGFYGTAYDDKEISLGVADVFKIRGIYEGVSGTPLPPSAVLNEYTGTLVNQEVLVGQTSEARAVLMNYAGDDNTSYFYYTNDKVFLTDEYIVGKTSGAIVAATIVSAGSPNITSRYYFDDGQRDGFYDLAKLTRKAGEPAPSNAILVVFDYFTHTGTGNFFDVGSYAGVDYREIPVYSPNRVDLGGLEPDGQFELSDAVDFRPVVGHILGSNNFPDTTPNANSAVDLSNSTSGAVYAPFGYDTGRSFEGSRTGIATSGANTVDSPVNGTSVTGDITFYVARIDKIFLHKSGTWMISTGIPAITPTKPKAIDDSIEMFELFIPAYTKKLSNIRVRTQDHRRYTMKDIGKINNRVTNLERITSLSLLERDTQTKQILDADGFDRFKSGFLVDNFKGHRVGDVNHPDYNISIDVSLGAMRPKTYQQFFDISLNTATSSSYQKTGDLITLPYSQISYVNQVKASRAMNVNPYEVFAFSGNVQLTPETDVWQDTTQLPEVRVNREGNFDTILAENDHALGTIWNAWQTTWVGEPSVVSSEVSSTTSGSWQGDPAQGGQWVSGEQVSRDITETPETQSRHGVTTSVVEDFVETRNDRVVSVTLIPFIRARTIEIDASNLKPDTNHFFFFDNIRVDQFIRPYTASYSTDGGVTVSSHLKTNGNGRLRGYFELPNSTTQRFPTGMRELFVTSSYYNLNSPASSGSGVYQAQGLLQSSQTEIVSTRNGRVVLERLVGERQFSRMGEVINSEPVDTVAPEVITVTLPEPIVDPVPDIPIDTVPPVVVVPDPVTEIPDPIVVEDVPVVSPVVPPPPEPDPPTPPPVIPGDTEPELPNEPEDRIFVRRRRRPNRRRGWQDPLAQSFLCEANGGMFLTSIDLYFKTKSDNLPVSIEIRQMVNGYPGQVVLPFSQVTMNPSVVNTSADGSSATTFTFPSPVFVEELGEYCFVVISNSNDYEAFISRMGENDLISGQVISGQPYAGSLFMSQNASTWTAEQMDDLKFNMKVASFDTSKTADLRFDNGALEASILQNNPIETFDGQTYVKVYNYLHGMYSTNSRSTITGVTGDKTGSVLTVGTGSVSSAPLPASGTETYSCGGNGQPAVVETESGTGTGCEIEIVVTDAVITSLTINKTGQAYNAANSLTIANFDGGTSDVTIPIDTVGDTLGGIPIDAINGSYTAITNIELDAFTVIPDINAYDFKAGYTASDSTLGGGAIATATRNYYFDTLHTMIPCLQFKNTRIHSSVYTTPMYSPEGYISGTAYSKNSVTEFITLNDNVFFGYPSIVASPTNEVAHMSSVKSFTCQLQLQTFNNNLSPVIDTATMGCLAIANRLNNIDTATGKKLDTTTNSLGAGTVFIPSTEPDGDNNAMVYVTRKVNLKTPATAIRVAADLFKPPTTELKFMYKTLKNDDATPFDDVGFEYFNTTGGADTTIEDDSKNFKEYEFTAENLPEFGAFCIKIIGQGSNTSVVPLVSALRCIALAT